MENLDVARTLTLLADLLEIQGANPFRIRAYRNAVNTVKSLGRPLQAMVAAGEDLTELPGVGKSVAAHIEELLATGSIDRLREVEAELPRTLAELMDLEGVGPKKARRLFDELDVRTVDDLERAIAAGRVQELEGFGKRSAEKIGRAIAGHRQRTGRFRLDEVEKLIAGLLAHMRDAPGVDELEVGRRRWATSTC
jgi:DNA polymerase (family 10)